MKFSYSWLQDHIEKKLPSLDEVTKILSIKSLEVEEIIGDTLEVKVLPHRQHDCFSHRGLARELCTLFGLKQKAVSSKREELNSLIANCQLPIAVTIEDVKRCPRYVAVRIDDVKVGAVRDDIKQKLESIGQRSISNVVDITNFVMNDIGQPMHAFDANKVVGKISVRIAKADEKMTTLDDKELTMNGTETVIADEDGILALAGVKGGKKALVDENTTSIIFESANFDSTITRKTSDLHNIRTDSSKRYEAQMTSEFAYEAICQAVSLVKEMFLEAKVGKVTDVYPRKEKNYKVGVSLSEINNLIGSNYKNEDVENIFSLSNFKFEKVVIEEKLKSLIDGIVNKPYKLGASVLYDGGEAFDCSSLTSWLYKEVGLQIPRISIDQYVFANKTEEKDLRFGDLIFTSNGDGKIYFESVEYMTGTKVEAGIDHCAMYLGGNKVVHATKLVGNVLIEDLQDFLKTRKITGLGRVKENLNEERYVVTVPFERLDIRIKEDLIEEVGRVMGYDNLPSVMPKLKRVGLPHKRLYYETKIKNILLANGFSEIYTYTFGDKGEVDIIKGLASDKEKLRTNLGNGVLNAVNMNLHNAPLLGIETVKVFEFGNVFNLESSKQIAESRRLSIGIEDGKKKSTFGEDIDFILSEIKRELNLSTLEYETVSTKPYVIEIDFDTMISNISEPTTYEPLHINQSQINYKSVAVYPFIVRDIACWTPFGTIWENVRDIALQVTDSRIVRIDCFDTFTKEIDNIKKTSYAFRIVLQSHDKTLTDEEANVVADKIYNLLKEKGYEIR